MARLPEFSSLLESEVIVCEAESWFVHVTVPPTEIVTVPGENAKFCIVTDAEFADEVVVALEVADKVEVVDIEDIVVVVVAPGCCVVQPLKRIIAKTGIRNNLFILSQCDIFISY